MKKGCFVKFVISITILIGAALYIVQHKLEDFILTPGKDVLINIVDDKLDNSFAPITDSRNKDSIKVLIRFYVDNIENVKDIANDNTDIILESVNTIITDSMISNEELIEFKHLIMSTLHERQ